MSSIEWTDETWNPVVGCARVSPGCEHCYAETMAARHVLMSRAQGRTSPYLPVVDVERRRWNRNAVFLPERLAEPLTWRSPRRMFVNSMSDLFHADLSFDQIASVFAVMAATPRHTYQVLTKRPARMLEFFAHTFGLENTEVTINREASERGWVIWDGRAPRGGWPKKTRPVDLFAYPRLPDMRTLSKRLPWVWPLPNVWLGVSVEDQAAADKRIPLLLQVPAAVRFISAEPLLGPIQLREEWLLGRFLHCPEDTDDPATDGCNGCEAVPSARRVDGPLSGDVCSAVRGPALAWVIIGGESGPGARPCDLAWLRSIVEQCERARVACFVKQLGARPVVEHAAPELQRRIKNPKGGDPAEWPADLRVRQFPEVAGGA
jgi:protein gp37